MKKRIWIIISVIVLIALLVGGYFLINKKDDNLSDSEKFSLEYPKIKEDNMFVYRGIDEIINILENGTGIVYLGFPECPWCQAYVEFLYNYAKEEKVSKIYYYNILNDRKNNTEEYQKIVSILKDFLEKDDEGNERIYVPNVSFVVKGKIIANDLETALDTHNLKDPKDYWTKEEQKDLELKLKENMKKVLAQTNTCTDCNKD